MGLWRAWRQDWWRVAVGMVVVMVLFGALFYNQQYGESSFVWVSHSLASSASAALNASLAAEQKPFSVSVHPHPLPSPVEDLPSPKNSSLTDGSSETLAEDPKNSSADDASSKNSSVTDGSSESFTSAEDPSLAEDPRSSAADDAYVKNSSWTDGSLEISTIAEDSSVSSSLADDPSVAGDPLENLDISATTSLSAPSQQEQELNSSDAVDEMMMGAPSNEGHESTMTVSFLKTEEASAPSPDLSMAEPPSYDESTQESLNESPENILAPLLTPPAVGSPEDPRDDGTLSSDAQTPPWRIELELGLKEAKTAIAMAPPVLDDPDLYPPLYHNLSSFKKSFEIMEQVFRVYVYEEGERPLIRSGPMTGIYSSEGQFIERMVNDNGFTVKDHTRAHVFFLPYSVANMVDRLFVPGTRTMQPINEYIRDYVNMLATKYPFWNATRGTDHFFVSCHDWGIATTFDHKELNKNAMKVLCNADLSDGFILEKDASLPEIYQHSIKLPRRIGGPGPKKRPILAFFAGQMHGRVRPLLLDHWKDKDPDMKIYGILPAGVMSYAKHMKSSKYCICAMGYEVNSPRIVEAIYYDCVPVIIADNFVLPFSDVIDWDSFSLTVAEAEIPNLKKKLLDIPDKQYQTMQKRLKQVRRHFMWHEQPVRYDMFHMILHSVWMRRLRQVIP